GGGGGGEGLRGAAGGGAGGKRGRGGGAGGGGGPRKGRPRRNQHGAAIADISGNVVEIDNGQHPLPRIAVEDDELEVVDLLLEQFTGRKRDQGQFVDRRPVLLLRRPQNGEVDEVHIGV